MTDYEWQFIGDDQWIFGTKVRGIVRVIIAEVYFDKDCDSPLGGWHWMVPIEGAEMKRGLSQNLQMAIAKAEKAFGSIKKEQSK